MKAGEFFKKFGIFGAKEYLSGSIFYEDRLMVFTNEDDLKQIVEAWELVESVGGWGNATALYDEFLCADLKKAINLVEQCQ